MPEEPWEIDGSVWTPRKKWADSKDYYDTPTCLAKVLDADWAMAYVPSEFQPASCRRASALPIMKACRESHGRISS